MGPAPLLHFSEDPAIDCFVPRPPPGEPGQSPAVWAIDSDHAPVYWFPRDCPRGTVWARTPEEQAALTGRFDTRAARLHVMERDWRPAMVSARLYVYAFPPALFAPWPEAYGYYVSPHEIRPLSVEPVGDLIARHAAADIELRFASNLWPFWDRVVASDLPFSGVRLRNARPR